MSGDIDWTVTALRTAQDGVTSSATAGGPAFLASLLRYVRLLFDQPLIATILTELRSQPSEGFALSVEKATYGIEEAVRSGVAEEVAGKLGRLDVELTTFLDEMTRRHPNQLGPVLKHMDAPVLWPLALRPREVVTHWGQHPQEVLDAAWEQLKRLASEVLPAIREGLRTAEQLPGSPAKSALTTVDTCVKTITDAEEHKKAVLALCSFMNRATFIFELDNARQELEASIAGTQKYPLPPSAVVRRSQGPEKRDELVHKLSTLTEEIVLRLRLRPVQHHVVNRLCSYFEHFGKEDLLETLRAQPTDKKRQNELIIQRAVDKFIFSEGLFPITHAEAGAGSIDTFLQSTAPKWAEAERTAPLLLELKQELSEYADIRDDASTAEESTRGTRAKAKATAAKRLSDLIKLAQAQAQQYRKHLLPRWSGHEVFAVVFYDGTRFTHTRAGVRLVYLGHEPPSEAIPLPGDE